MFSTNPLSTSPIGFGLMGMTWRAHQTPDEQTFAAMKTAIANGATFWSTVDFYGTSDPLAGVKLVKIFVKGCADPTTLAPTNDHAGVRASAEKVPSALGGVKSIDVFGPARQNPGVPLEETLGELKALKAHVIHPLSLVEVEFSLWSTDILTNGVAAIAKSLNIPVVAYSPLGRGFLTELVGKLTAFAQKKKVTPPQLALAWFLSNSNSSSTGTIIPIPGATTFQRVEENTQKVILLDEKTQLDAILNSVQVVGGRYNKQLEYTLWG
ncbi:putative pyridoxal reductase protein [Eutypa lata UCREL1]|uniref:Putative pyridoxal reductase protein n=1 Tax=Eutypa lata (strain UCR-EL1) TaxID=1287681 RepID=M7SFM1_EUTLA|nr:putative pyridoxal reductase protein [Eutypa lata UCREL1]